MIDGFAIEVLNLMCGEYTEDSDKCPPLMKLTPRLARSNKRRPKSALLPMISVLESVDTE